MGHNLEILQGREGDSHNANVAQPASEDTYATSKATRTSDSVKYRSTNQAPLRLSSRGLRGKPLDGRLFSLPGPPHHDGRRRISSYYSSGEQVFRQESPSFSSSRSCRHSCSMGRGVTGDGGVRMGVFREDLREGGEMGCVRRISCRVYVRIFRVCMLRCAIYAWGYSDG